MGVSIVSVVVLLGVLIFVHELGHFLVAKSLGVGVLKFSLGFGPKLIGRKVGETEYLLSMIPLGGYVKLLGESEQEKVAPEDERRSFSHQTVWRRMGIVLSGPLFNFLFAIVALACIFMIGIPALTSDIGAVQQGSPAEAAGIREGDRVLAIDGRAVNGWGDLADMILTSQGRELTLAFERGGERFAARVKPEAGTGKNVFGEDVEVFRIGISASSNTFIERQNSAEVLWSGILRTGTITKLTILSVVKMITGDVSPSNLGGPIFIAQMAGAHVKKGILNFVFFMTVLSINLAVLNLLPIPILDGGHLLFFLIEAVTGKEVSIKWRERAQ